MEIIKLLALLFGCAILFSSCATRPSQNLSYQEKPFRAHLIFESTGASSGAILTSIPSIDADGTPKKALCLEFTSPENLCGIKVEKRDGETKVSLDGLVISSPYAERLLSVSELFDIDATVKESSVETIDGQSLNFIKAVSDDGKEFSIHLYPASGLPRRISGIVNGSTCTVDVISFEIISD